MRDTGISLDFIKQSLVINNAGNGCKERSIQISVYLEESGLSKVEKKEFKQFLVEFGEVFSDKPGLTQVAWREINIGSAALLASKPYRYCKMKQNIIDYHIQKMLADDNSY